MAQSKVADLTDRIMPKGFHQRLIALLKSDTRFVDDAGELVTAAVMDRAWKIDHGLVRLLLSCADIKAKFFDDIDGHWVFNTNTFIDYVSDKNFLANSYTRFRNRIGLNIDDKFLRERGEVSLVWPYKDCVLEGGQTKEEEKRRELFFNEVLAQDEIDRLFDPKVLTNWRRYTVDGVEEVTAIKRDERGTMRENLLIKGNNLLALHTLKKQFRGQVKLIYIDPPYNTGNDSFGYNDSFNHASWLTFMKNRLEVARELLRDDGSIFVHCDDNEQAYLKVLMDDVFGRENLRNIVLTRRFDKNINTQFISTGLRSLNSGADYILIYAKSTQALFNPVYKPATEKRSQTGYWKGFWNSANRPTMRYPILGVTIAKGQWKWGQTIAFEALQNYQEYLDHFSGDMSLEEYWTKTGKTKRFLRRNLNANKGKNKGIEHWIPPSEGILRNSNWTDILTTETHRIVTFNSPKSENLISVIVDMATHPNDIILDFFAGSGTTAAVAHKMGRQWITVEQMGYVETITLERLAKVVGRRVTQEGTQELDYDKGGISPSVNWQGGGDFLYCELLPYNAAYLDKISCASSSVELEQLWRDIAENSFLNWYVNPETPDEAVADFMAIGQSEGGLAKQKQLLTELLNKNQLYVNLSEIEDADFGVSEEDKALNRAFYGE